MNRITVTSLLAAIAVYACLLAAGSSSLAQTSAARTTASATIASPLGSLGNIDIDADSSSLGQGYIVYQNAHMTAENGTKMDADQIRGNLAQGTNSIQNVVATGNVKAYLAQPDLHRTYTVTADKAVYNPATQQIVLTGNVKTVVTSSYTAGPLVQTGDTGVIKLGPAPDYPQITMNHVHTTFTPER